MSEIKRYTTLVMRDSFGWLCPIDNGQPARVVLESDYESEHDARVKAEVSRDKYLEYVPMLTRADVRIAYLEKQLAEAGQNAVFAVNEIGKLQKQLDEAEGWKGR